MLTKIKVITAVLSVAAAISLASNGYAQANQAPLFNAAGSSAAFNAIALAARISNPGGTSGVCGDHNWTKKSTAMAIDNRPGGINAVTGNIWIVWNDTPEPSRTVCAYLSIDSVVGNRLFFAVPRGSVSIPSSAIGEAGDNLVPLLPTDEALPSNILNDLTEASGTGNSVFNAAPSDIRPEDALFATTRALTPLNQGGLGYGPGNIGATILSQFSTKSAQVVNFAISGTDPITGGTVPPFSTDNVGAQVLVILVNSTNKGTGHLGSSAFGNVDRFVLSKVLDGTLGCTRDLIPSSGLSQFALTVLEREPLSGTFNTLEFSVPRSVEVGSSQEAGINAQNPLNLSGPCGSVRQRVIGTSEMVNVLGTTTGGTGPGIPDSIGYAFWSFGNVSAIVSTAKYLAVDGVDPIHATYTGGTLPTCTAPCPGALIFPNVVNGSYPVWNVLRVVTPSPEPTGIHSLVTAAQREVAQIPDFVAFGKLNVFRSHYLQSGVQPVNGHLPRSTEAGGDMGGAVFTVQADKDFVTDTGTELVNFKQ